MKHEAVMMVILKFFFLFMAGTMAGWGLEVFWRRYFGKARRWINPGFLSGPWLPLYGFGTVVLYFLSELRLPLSLRALVFLFILTLLEYIAGKIFIGHFKIRLWDYSKSWGNVQGLVCPLYSFLWTLLGLIFYYGVFPLLKEDVSFLLHNLEFSFFVGIYAGIFGVDAFHSFGLANRIKTVVNESSEKWHVDFEKFKLELRDKVESGVRNRTHYLLPFRGESGHSFRSELKRHGRLHFRIREEKKKNKPEEV